MTMRWERAARGLWRLLSRPAASLTLLGSGPARTGTRSADSRESAEPIRTGALLQDYAQSAGPTRQLLCDCGLSPETHKLLKQAKDHVMTNEEREAQRQSWARQDKD